VAKIVIDESELTDPVSMQILERLSRFFDRLDDPYRMPEAMVKFVEDQRKAGVDTYYSMPIGYGHIAMQLRMTFKRDFMVMEFTAPDGMRLMELRLHK
jgi:hypothetical protein